jgi:hypothetical protein
MNIDEIREICFRYASENRGLPSTKTAGRLEYERIQKEEKKKKRDQLRRDRSDLAAMGYDSEMGERHPALGALRGAAFLGGARGVISLAAGRNNSEIAGRAAGGAAVGGIAGLIHDFIQRQRRKSILQNRTNLLQQYGHGEH